MATMVQQFQTIRVPVSKRSSSLITSTTKKVAHHDLVPGAAANHQRRAQLYDDDDSDEEYSDEEQPVQVAPVVGRVKVPQVTTTRATQKPKEVKVTKAAAALVESSVEEEPDKLSQLLDKSTFTCNELTTGYYADEGLGCEIFHYCHNNAKYSWICPEGFLFHQVHLICMPQTHENFCAKSEKYRIVNDYLYKPVNLEEHQTKPNISLRYSERYFPEEFDFYFGDRYGESSEEEEELSQPQKKQESIKAGPVTHPTKGNRQIVSNDLAENNRPVVRRPSIVHRTSTTTPAPSYDSDADDEYYYEM